MARGACAGSSKASDWKSGAWLLFSPQGREFIKENRYPTLDLWREMGDMRDYGVYVDAGDINLEGAKDVCLVGNTHANIYVSSPDILHHIIVMYGATATLIMRNYAVASVLKIDGEVRINHDKTTRVINE